MLDTGWLLRMSVLLALIPLGGCAGGAAATGRDAVYQSSTMSALALGVYEGTQPCSELLRHGDTGLGTYDALDGEMVVLDGVCYRAGADGSVSAMPPETLSPFGMVAFMKSDREARLAPGTTLPDVYALLDGMRESENLPCVIRIDGVFEKIRVRSVPAQAPPYPPLAEAVKHQAVFDCENVQGTIVGFYMPAYLAGVSVPGYHLHFISQDRAHGGHLLDCTTGEALCHVQTKPRLELDLPTHGDFVTTDLTQFAGEALQKAEKK